MRELRAIPKKEWFTQKCGKQLKEYFPMWWKAAVRLPLTNIDPEHIVMEVNLPVEFMVLCLWNGAWVSRDWRPYVRYAIANRLRNRRALLFSDTFDEVVDDFLQYQLEGGTFATRNKLKKTAIFVIQNLSSSPQDTAAARLILSNLNDIEDNNLMQPFHWIRATLGCADTPIFGMNLVNSEMQRQKVTLCKMLRGPN